MKAELLKVRFLPTARYVMVGTLALLVLACIAVLIIGPDQGDSSWHTAPAAVVVLTTLITPILLGAWIIGLEFSSKTIRLAATAQPDRAKLILRKLATAVLLVVGMTAISLLLMVASEVVMSTIGGSSPKYDEEFRTAASVLMNALLWGTFSFGLVLTLRNFTAGLVAALAIRFVLDSPLSIGLRQIPTVGDYTFGSAADSIVNLILGDPADLKAGIAILTAALWLIAVNALGTARFVLSDLK